MAKAKANGQVAGEEGVWHWLSPELPGNHLLVEDLADRSMHDEHGEGQGSQGGHGLRPEEAGDGRWALAQGIAVHGLQELGEQRHEENSANDGIVEVKLGHTEKQRRIGSEEEPQGIHGLLLLVLLGVQHDVAHCDDAHGHFHQSPERMEASEVPNQGMHHLSVHWMFFAAVEA
eukprot:Skav211964  [mRNA]  locus=scaffold433:295174:298623:+ [translate_table: standard]